jgi:hypothetical protein
MNKPRTYRPLPLALTLLIATFSALVALAVSGGHDAEAHGTAGSHADMHATVGTASGMSGKEVALRSQMRKLWEDHITWTRMVIVDFAAGLPDLKAAEQRLLRNQVDIGNAIKPYYGVAAGNALTKSCARTSSRPCPCSRTRRPATRRNSSRPSTPGRRTRTRSPGS